MSSHSISHLNVDLRFMPLKSAFVTARGRTEVARALVVQLHLEDGTLGLGAASPAGYVTHETYESAEAAIRAMGESGLGASVLDHDDLFAAFRTDFPGDHAARAAVEMAVMDAFGLVTGQPLWRYWGAKTTQISTDLTVPLNSLEEARQVAADAHADGISHLKIKVNGAYPRDMLQRIRDVHEAAPQAVLLVDANQSFTPDTALAFLDILEAENLPVALFEQPVAARDYAGLARVARDSVVPVGADESVVTPEDALRVFEAGGVPIFNIKLMKSGISGSLEIIRLCQDRGTILMLGCMLECNIGIGAAVQLACGTGAFRYFDLDAPLLLAGDVAEGAFQLAGTVMTPADVPGLGARLLENTPGNKPSVVV